MPHSVFVCVCVLKRLVLLMAIKRNSEKALDLSEVSEENLNCMYSCFVGDCTLPSERLSF